MTSTRFRKTFRYPTDGTSDDNMPQELDEEEQEKFIAKLRKEDQNQNEFFKKIFLAVPLISIITFVPALAASQLFQARIVGIFGISSLACTAYTLLFISHSKARPAQPVTTVAKKQSPRRRYLNLLNGGLSFLILLNAYFMKDRKGAYDGLWLLCTLPAVVFAFSIIVKRTMSSVDVDELERLRYEYKGA